VDLGIQSDMKIVLNGRIGESDPEQGDRIFVPYVTSFIKMVLKICQLLPDTYELSWEIIAATLIGHRIDLHHVDPD
jgi:hypothetical protein